MSQTKYCVVMTAERPEEYVLFGWFCVAQGVIFHTFLVKDDPTII